jgi:hypothetical protein
MEVHDIVSAAVHLNDTWDVQKWFCDQNYPAYLKTLRKAGLKCPKFTKVVEDGIVAVQSKIVDSANARKFFIIDIPENKQVINAFGVYSWKRDGKGDVIEGKPEHGDDGTSDILDSIRYPFQCLYTRGGRVMISSAGGDVVKKPKELEQPDLKTLVKNVNEQKMSKQVTELATGSSESRSIKKKGRIFWG